MGTVRVVMMMMMMMMMMIHDGHDDDIKYFGPFPFTLVSCVLTFLAFCFDSGHAYHFN